MTPAISGSMNKETIKAESPKGGGMRQYGQDGGPWLSVTLLWTRPQGPSEEAQRGMSGRAIEACRLMHEEPDGPWLATFSRADDETTETLLAIAREIYPELDIQAVRVS